MSDFSEMTEAFEQARTAPDALERATEVRPGAVFAYLTVIEAATSSAGRKGWLCVCVCGNRRVISKGDLLRAKHPTKSCGCKRKTTHGYSNSPTYMTWGKMIQRATNPNNDRSADYIGRGITVCDDWKVFENFLRDMGERPEGMSLDRIDNSKGYSPENCRWATPKEQLNNTRRNRFLTLNGETKTVAQWAEEAGINAGTIYSRLGRGWSGADLLVVASNTGFRRKNAVRCKECQDIRDQMEARRRG